MLQAVTFDFWNTLMYERDEDLRRRRLPRIERALAAAGRTVRAGDVASAHDDAFIAYQAAWLENRQYTSLHAAGTIAQSLALDDELVPVIDGAFMRAGLESDIVACDGAVEVVRALAERGVRLAVICDVGLTPTAALKEHLRRAGMLEHFGVTIFSDDLGVYKPDVRMFTAALAALGDIAPDAAAHVGDRRRTDVGGALAAGMRAIRYSAIYDDPDEAPIEHDHVTELGALLDVLQ